MPDIQKIYETYDTEGDDALIVLGVAGPGYGNEKSEEGIKEFLDENGYTYPVLMDTTGELFSAYGIYSYPTTFMIDRDGNVFSYASGQLNEDMMKNIIEQTMEGKRDSKMNRSRARAIRRKYQRRTRVTVQKAWILSALAAAVIVYGAAA